MKFSFKHLQIYIYKLKCYIFGEMGHKNDPKKILLNANCPLDFIISRVDKLGFADIIFLLLLTIVENERENGQNTYGV